MNNYIFPKDIRITYRIALYIGFPAMTLFTGILWREAIRQFEEYSIMAFSIIWTIFTVCIYINGWRSNKYVNMQYCIDDKVLRNYSGAFRESLDLTKPHHIFQVECVLHIVKGGKISVYLDVYAPTNIPPLAHTTFEGINAIIKLWKKGYMFKERQTNY